MSDGAGAISPPFTGISDGTLSAGKPWTQTLARTMRDDIDHVHQLVHDTVSGHDHDGVNSALISAAASMILPDAPVLKAGGGTGAAWTPLSIAADSGAAQAKIALLRVRLDTTAAGAAYVELRKTGTAPATARRVDLIAGGLAGQLRAAERTVLVPLDGSESFDYQAVFPGSGSWDIHLEGWIV